MVHRDGAKMELILVLPIRGDGSSGVCSVNI